ncbi:carbohydrate esterase family 4 protein [Trametes sanguinea]|nr:carbohydrate esterase family 4 protein [Trametes sanguinea]
MKLAAVSAIALPALVSAHGIRDVHHARQAAAAASSPASVGTSAVASPATSAGTAATGTATAPVASGPGSLTFTLASTNPSAIPLTEIASGMSSAPTVAASTTFASGTTPTFLPNAPPLPNALSLNPANYPPLDKTPPVDSPEVQQWIKEVNATGIQIPDFSPTVAGGCPTNPDAVNDQSRCWWTCGGCAAPDDIEQCPDKMTWGLTYDDGPALYTGDLLAYLDQANLKATFFVVGSRAISYPALLQEEYMAQHQIAVHTWSHPPMTTLTNEQIIAELGWTKKVIKDVLGVTPTFWRPPYGDVDNRVRAIAKAMGLQTSIWTRISPEATFDTGDFDIAGGLTTSTQVLNNWENIIGNATTIDHGFIVLEHDLFQQTVDIAMDYILPDALAHQPPFKIEPIISCLNKPLQDAYIETNDNSSNPIGIATGSASSAEASGNSSGASANGKNSAMGIAAPSSMGAIALALVSGVVALFL